MMTSISARACSSDTPGLSLATTSKIIVLAVLKIPCWNCLGRPEVQPSLLGKWKSGGMTPITV